MKTSPAILLLTVAPLLFSAQASPRAPEKPAVAKPAPLAEIDRRIRAEFWAPDLKGVDWNTAVEKAAADLAAAGNDADRDAAYDRLLARLDDSHTFRVPAGRLPETRWATAGLRIGREGSGYAVKAVFPGGPAERAGLRLGDRIVSIGGRAYGSARTDFRGLFLALEGPPRSSVQVAWETAAGDHRSAALELEPEPPGDALVWRSARVLRRVGHAWGYARLWGISPEVALAVVDLLSDRSDSAAAKPELAGLGEIDGFLLDVRGNSGGYDPGILSTFLRGRWSAGDYRVRSRGKTRTVPPEYRPLPVALLVNSGTASSGEALALKFRRHGIGPIVGEETAGMLSGGAAVAKLPDGSSLWFSARAIEDAEGRSYEGRGLRPDVVVPDRPGKAGEEDAVVEAAIQALEARRKK